MSAGTWPEGWIGDEVAMVYGGDGNAIDCFDYTAEELQGRADEILGKPIVTMVPNRWATLAHD